jgi:hypothetical protein
MDLSRTTLSLSMVHVGPSGDGLGGQAFMEQYNGNIQLNFIYQSRPSDLEILACHDTISLRGG